MVHLMFFFDYKLLQATVDLCLGVKYSFPIYRVLIFPGVQVWSSYNSLCLLYRHTCPDRPWGPTSLLYNWYRVFFPGVKRLGSGVDHPPPSSAEVKERVELYLFSPSGPSWPVLGWTLPLPFRVQAGSWSLRTWSELLLHAFHAPHLI